MTYAASKWWVPGIAHSLVGPASEVHFGKVVNPAKVRNEIGRTDEQSFAERFEKWEAPELADLAESVAFAAR